TRSSSWRRCAPNTACCSFPGSTSAFPSTSGSATARSCSTSRKRWRRRSGPSGGCSPTEMRVVPLDAFRDKLSIAATVAAVERGYLTDLRTAAAVALTLRYLAPRDAKEALLVGAGALARITARAMVAELPLQQLTVWNRTAERAEALARDVSSLVPTRVAPALEPAVRRHRVVVTATASTTPLIKAAWVRAGTHVTSVGTGSPEKAELEPALLAKADKLVSDRTVQTERYGNLHHALEAKAMTRQQVYGELGDLAAGRLPGRETASEITVADLTGVGVQDAAVAQALVEALGL